MRVFISAGLFHPSKLGGPAKTLYWLAKGFVSKNVDVSVVTSNNFIEKGLVEFDKWTIVNNIRIRYCSAKSKLNHKVIWHSIKELRNCDALLLSSIFYLPSLFIAFFAAFTSKKIIWSPRGELFESALKGKKIKILYIKLLRLFFTKRSIFHATSPDEQNCIKKYFGNRVKVVVIPNYIELPEKQNRVDDKDNYFLYVGRIAPIKALDKLILGLAKSKSFMRSNYKLLIAGGVEKQFERYFEQLQLILKNNESLKEKVIFLGDVEGEEKYKLYANAYFSILVSHSENFGNVVIEALSQGTPVIASKGTPWKQLAEKKAGFWIDNDENSIACCIDVALKMGNEEYQRTRSNAYEFSKEFDIYTNIDNWIKVIQ